MPRRHRALALAIGISALAACGSAPVTTESVVTLADAPAVTNTRETPTSDAAPTPEGPATDQLSIADAMLPDDAFAPPWDPKNRDEQYRGYGVGPNQSSCPEYEIAESFGGRDGGWVFWWIDGGNANQYVARERYPGEGAEIVAMVAAAAERCPTVSWGEGGDLTIAPLELGDDVAGFQFVTETGRDLGYAAVTTWGDLMSVLWVPMWTNIDGGFPDLAPERFAEIAQQMRDRLVAAGPATSAELATTTTVPPPTTTLPGTAPSTVPPTTIRPTTTTTTVAVEPSGTAALLLDTDDLGPGWIVFDIRERPHQPPDDEFVADCPAAQSIDDADALFEWDVDAESNGSGGSTLEADLGQIIGRAPDEATARSIVEQFARISECDLTDEFGDDMTVTGGLVEIAGAAAAAEFRATVDAELVSELLLIAVDDLLLVVGIEGNRDDVIELTFEIAERAVAKIRGS